VLALKYFTIDWWSGYQANEDVDPMEAIRAYQVHLRGIRDRLTPELIMLQEEVSLHDATLLSLEVRGGLCILRLTLGDGRGIELRYGGLTSLESVQKPENSLDIGGYGDLGYDEVDVCEDGSFEHRLLFASSIELRLRFATLDLQLSPAN
jgi:hypothetical protein